MTVPRMKATATLLDNGKVLIVGGEAYSTATDRLLASAELYDPASGKFTPTGSMYSARAGHTATLLADGRVLIAGGWGCGTAKGCTATDAATTVEQQLTSAEIYDPSSGRFSRTGSMTAGHANAVATRLDDGRVLLAGGYGARADLYDPTSGQFSGTGPSFNLLAGDPTATLLPNGQVLVTGTSESGPSAELFDPVTARFLPLSFGIEGTTLPQAATLLKDGRVLLYESGELKIYDPATSLFTPAGSLTSPIGNPSATLLSDGRVVFAGGWISGPDSSVSVASASIYDAATSIHPIGSLNTARLYQTATLLPDGSVLIAGGTADGNDALSSAELCR